MTVTTGKVVQRAATEPVAGSSADERKLFDPRSPARYSQVFDVDLSGYQIQGAGIEKPTVFVLEKLVAGVFEALRLKGERQQLSYDHNALTITTPGRYRLRIEGAQDSGTAVLEGDSLRRWS